jgi:hypothetical protein
MKPNMKLEMPRWCTQCNRELELVIVDNQENLVCRQCSRIEWGYIASERELVLKLQEHLYGDEYKIAGILSILRRLPPNPPPINKVKILAKLHGIRKRDEDNKRRIDAAVHRTVKEYGEVLKKLGKE